MSSITCTKLTVCILSAVLIQIIGLSLFVLGFFPVKPALSGFSGPESFRPTGCGSGGYQNVSELRPEELKSLYQELCEIPPSYDRLVLMVIDGLPAEFVLGKPGQPPSKVFLEAMPYTQSLLANGMAVGYHAKAAPPTVTMPRLKAMVSGAIGGFLDVAFNFNTQAFLDDNIINQFFSIGWKMVMLGDETWLKLFPGLFTRHDGVSSFYVKDTVVVDQNVSRHLSDELDRTDWSLLVLHYLGLDHVGHIGGRSSVLMGPKLKEMDEVIQTVHKSTKQFEENNHERTLLVVVSDHGMTDNGNHGGSSYEETDSLVLFVGLKQTSSGFRAVTHSTIDQVDIAPTLALLFGVPVPKNNVGIVIPEISDSLTDDQWLRTLELNSLQILRLLKAELSGLSCEHIICDATTNVQLRRIDNCQSSDEEMFCCLFENAVVLHNSWRSKRLSGSSRDEYGSTVSAYYDFLRATSKWLSRRATHKPVSLLTFGVAAMVLSCFSFIGIFLWLDQEIYSWKGQCHPSLEDKKLKWHLDDYYVLAIVSILVLSMGSSSMVEEEQYIWHFLTSTFYLILLRKAIQSSKGAAHNIRIISIIVVLVSGRIMRGWHQGGVNWTHLPDISNWLEQAGNDYIKSIQLISWVLTLSFGFYCLWMFRSRFHLILVIGFSFLLSGLLVLRHIINHNDDTAPSYAATSTAQTIYASLGFLTLGSIIGVPWLIPAQNPKITPSHGFCFTKNFLAADEMKSLFVGFRDPLYVVGWAYIFCWCLLQLLLQQPINSMPMALLLLQIMASIICFSNNFMNLKQWVEVAALYSLGMAGHFALGNTNTLATIDVAGAFIVLPLDWLTRLSILMFFITYASPMLAILSLVMYTSMAEKSFRMNTVDTDTGHFLKTTVCFPCLVPLGVNSILLLAYTIVLLLMRNHLFVWSVFSPKYLYVCATTVCIYVGVVVVFLTAVYTTWVVSFRRRRTSSTIKDD